MSKKLYMIAAMAIKAVYGGFGKNRGSTEWSDTVVEYEGQPLQVLSIGGSDEWLDWLWNGVLASWDGVKLCSWFSARRINKYFKRKPGMPLLVTGHSKAGPTALYWKLRYGADYCVTFCPARGFRTRIAIENTIIFIDPDDPVPKLGALNFDHPVCEVVTLPDDPGWRISDHLIEHIIKFLDGNK